MKAMVDKRIHCVFTAVFMLGALYAINFNQHSTAHYAVPEIDLQRRN